ncbi:MAG: homocysteine S-methyltransferase family protein [Acidobacteria bacterium]|nr:homocysteine S-methyltransferase family protein [Acidobacteriota bacterium]
MPAPLDWKTVLKIDPPALTESAVWERVGGDPMRLLETAEGRNRLEAIYEEYAVAARRHTLPILMFAPTWRANREHAETGANAAALDFVGRFSSWVGALMGPRGDCYTPAAALSRQDARAFHRWQAGELAGAGFILISTMPSVGEALGIVDIVPVPCFVSFVITSRGQLLDGTPLAEAITQIDGEALSAPMGYWINCVHPRTAIEGLRAMGPGPALERILGVQGNTSRLDPRSFSASVDFACDPADRFAEDMMEIHRRFSIPILGGCCGTRAEHLDALAGHLAALRRGENPREGPT